MGRGKTHCRAYQLSDSPFPFCQQRIEQRPQHQPHSQPQAVKKYEAEVTSSELSNPQYNLREHPRVTPPSKVQHHPELGKLTLLTQTRLEAIKETKVT